MWIDSINIENRFVSIYQKSTSSQSVAVKVLKIHFTALAEFYETNTQHTRLQRKLCRFLELAIWSHLQSPKSTDRWLSTYVGNYQLLKEFLDYISRSSEYPDKRKMTCVHSHLWCYIRQHSNHSKSQ